MKGKIIKVQNDQNFLWFRLKPEMLSLQCIDRIRFAIDENKEPLVNYDLKKPYEKQIPRSFGFEKEGKIFAIMICEKEFINYIVIKGHPLFKKVEDLLHEELEF